MKHFLSIAFFTVVLALSAQSQTLVHYWNFNDPTNEGTLLTPQSLLQGASITHIQGGLSAIDVSGGTGQNFNIENLNARNGDASGNHLRFNNPIGGTLIFALPTTGFKDVVVKFATRRSDQVQALKFGNIQQMALHTLKLLESIQMTEILHYKV